MKSAQTTTCKNLAELLSYTDLSGDHKKQYYGNGKNAIRGIVHTYTCGRVTAEVRIKVYSYRWHKKVVDYRVDGELTTRRGVKKLAKY